MDGATPQSSTLENVLGLIGFLVFIAYWIAAIFGMGFWWGLALGWIPAAILTGLTVLAIPFLPMIICMLVLFGIYLWLQ